LSFARLAAKMRVRSARNCSACACKPNALSNLIAMYLPVRLCYLALAGSILCSVSLARAADDVEAAVERAARAHLAELISTAGLRKPSVELVVLARETVNPCTANAGIEAIDTRSVTRMRFAASCAEPAWRAEFVVRATISAEVVTAARDLRAGEVIDATAVTLERRDLVAPAEAISDPALVVGKTSRRVLRSGQLVSRRWLVEPLLVRRGADVTILARDVGVEVRVAGEALAAGRRNEIIQVRNKTNGNVIRA